MYHRIKWSSGQQILEMFGLLVVIVQQIWIRNLSS